MQNDYNPIPDVMIMLLEYLLKKMLLMGLPDLNLETISKLGPIFSAIAIIVAVWTLQENHEWNRRNFASQLIFNWNKQTKQVIDEIEKLEPRIIDFKDGRLTQITQRKTQKIYFSKFSENNKEWQLRTKFIHLLNEFEYIASAYNNAVGDKKMIEESFKDIYVKWGVCT